MSASFLITLAVLAASVAADPLLYATTYPYSQVASAPLVAAGPVTSIGAPVVATAGVQTLPYPYAGAYSSVNPYAGAYSSAYPYAGAYSLANPYAGAYSSAYTSQYIQDVQPSVYSYQVPAVSSAYSLPYYDYYYALRK